MIAVDPVYRDAAFKQRRCQLVERPVALNVAKQHGGPRRRGKRGQARFDVMPMLVNVADENDGHAVPR